MNGKIVTHLENLEIHADALMKVPANEQHLGNMQSIISIALLEIKSCLEIITNPNNCPKPSTPTSL